MVEERLQENAFEVGSYLKEELLQLSKEFPIMGSIRGQGLFLGIEFVDLNINPLPIQATYFVNRMKDHGVLMSTDGPDNNVIKIKPPMVFSIDNAKELIFLLASKSQIIFDIGANIGWYSLNFSKLENVNKIYSFEPIPRTFDYLLKHIDLNNIDKVFPNNLALSDRNGEVEFYFTKQETGSSSMRNIQDRDEINKVVCQTKTLTDFVIDNETKIDMIKCDVEGSELFVFKGGIEILERDKPFIFTEMLRKWAAKFEYHPDDIINLLSSIGYRCFAYVDEELEEFFCIKTETKPTNYFFLHKDKHYEIIGSIGF